jgi:hypothetical protein
LTNLSEKDDLSFCSSSLCFFILAFINTYYLFTNFYISMYYVLEVLMGPMTFSWLYPQHNEQSLAYSRCLVNISWMIFFPFVFKLSNLLYSYKAPNWLYGKLRNMPVKPSWADPWNSASLFHYHRTSPLCCRLTNLPSLGLAMYYWLCLEHPFSFNLSGRINSLWPWLIYGITLIWSLVYVHANRIHYSTILGLHLTWWIPTPSTVTGIE